MKLLRTFFGQILRKQDVDYQNNGDREAITRLSIDITAKQGGIISGLDVFKSIDGLSVLITPGVFYSTGDFNATNNLGGGERGQVYTTQSFTGLPSTAPIANQPSFLVVYIKIANQNSNPDPTQLQTTTTSKNIQTGENVLTRDYPAGAIAISNPVLLTEVNKFNGVPVAILQVDYIGVSQVSSNGTVQVIDTTVKRDYIIGGAVDVARQQLIASAVPNNFITTRMIGTQQITGDKFLTGTITSAAIASYDGSANIATTGNGIATDHLKTGAVTEDKVNYISGLNDFSQRNHVLNASFEISSTDLINWTTVGDTGTSASIESNASTTKFGIRSAKLAGGSAAGVAKSINISQKIDFGGPVNGQSITAYFYAKPLNDFNTLISGTNGINGTLNFYNNINDTNPTTTQAFVGYTGVATGEFIQLGTSAPIVLPTTSTPISAIGIQIGGSFDNTVYIDGAYLGLTSLTPKFDVSLEEQIGADLNANNITQGSLDGARLADGAVVTSKIRAADGSVLSDGGFGIRGDQIRSGTIAATALQDHSITNQQLAAGVSAVPRNAILMFMVKDGTTLSDPIAKGCPAGFAYVTEMEGRFPLGANSASAFTDYANPGSKKGTSIVGRNGGATDAFIGTTPGAGDHGHGSSGSSSQSGGGASDSSQVGHQHPNAGTHAHEEQVPFVTMIFCKQL